MKTVTVTITLSAEENQASIDMSTKLGISKQHFVHRQYRKQMIRESLVSNNEVDAEMGMDHSALMKKRSNDLAIRQKGSE